MFVVFEYFVFLIISYVSRNDSQVSDDLKIFDTIFENIKTKLNDSLVKKMPMTFDLWNINF